MPSLFLLNYPLYFRALMCYNMIKVKLHSEVNMNSKLKNDNIDFLFKAILELKSPEECYDFFEDLCTIQELKAISQRLVVAKMLSEKCVYTDIVNATGASTATISRVNRSLQYGCDGYDIIFERIRQKEENEQV